MTKKKRNKKEDVVIETNLDAASKQILAEKLGEELFSLLDDFGDEEAPLTLPSRGRYYIYSDSH